MEFRAVQIEQLKLCYATSKPAELLNLFPGFTKHQIKNKANNLGLKKASGYGGRIQLTDDQIDWLKANYADTSNAELCKKLGVTQSVLTKRANDYGLKKSDAYLRSMVSKKFIEEGKKTRFNAGKLAWNKGKKLIEYASQETIEKISKTQFKKGLIPNNHQPLWFERITKDGYIEIKYQDVSCRRNFMLKHRWVWIQVNGPIPKGMALEFIDGDKMNVALDNLRLVTRKDLLLKNQLLDASILKRNLKVQDKKSQEIIKREFPQLIEAKRSQIQLNRELKKI